MIGKLTITISGTEYMQLKEYEAKYKRFIVYNLCILILWIGLALVVCFK